VGLCGPRAAWFRCAPERAASRSSSSTRNATLAPDGREIDYPVEVPQREDVLVRATAGEALTRL
jgi:hypothetical protein